MTEWKPVGDGSQLVDDNNYLVAWRSHSDYSYFGPYLAYYDSCENKFFSLHGPLGCPMQVDLYSEIPELPRHPSCEGDYKLIYERPEK
jgi:hypothetical protein